MTSFKDCCDNLCCSAVGNEGFGGSQLGRPFSFYRDQCQDVPPTGFRNIGSFINPSGSLHGTVYANLNGEVVGRLSGRIEGLSGILGRMGCLGNFGNCGLSLPFSVQFGNRTL